MPTYPPDGKNISHIPPIPFCCTPPKPQCRSRSSIKPPFIRRLRSSPCPTFLNISSRRAHPTSQRNSNVKKQRPFQQRPHIEQWECRELGTRLGTKGSKATTSSHGDFVLVWRRRRGGTHRRSARLRIAGKKAGDDVV